MRKIILMILVFGSLYGSAQVTQYIGAPNTTVRARGNFLVDSVLRPPVRDTLLNPTVGEIRYRAADQSLYVCISLTGLRWVQINPVFGNKLNISDTAAMLSPYLRLVTAQGLFLTNTRFLDSLAAHHTRILAAGGGGTTETASNGLTKTGNDIQLGGTLATPTTITTAGNNFVIYNSNGTSSTTITQLPTYFRLQKNHFSTGTSSNLDVGNEIDMLVENTSLPESRIRIRKDSIEINPYLGQLSMAALQTAAASDDLAMVWNPGTKRVGSKAFPTSADSSVFVTRTYLNSQTSNIYPVRPLRLLNDSTFYLPEANGTTDSGYVTPVKFDYWDDKVGQDQFLDSLLAHSTRIGEGAANAFDDFETVGSSTVRFTKPNGTYVDLDLSCLAFLADTYVPAWADITGKPTIDATPTNGSTNAVQSDGVFDALAAAAISTTDNNLTVSGSAVTTKKGWQTYTDGATITINTANGFNWKGTIAGNRTIAITNPQDGAYLTIRIKQDATGSRTITWPSSVKWAGGTAPTLTTTANATDIFSFVYDATDGFYYQSGKDVK